MRSLLGLLCHRRGTVALMFGLTAVPLIGFAALGVEGGAWYVTKRASQNAADAAAYAGAVQLAFGSDAGTVDYRGKQFAAQNAFCDQGDAMAYPGSTCRTLPPGTTQSVQISIGSFANGVFSTSGSGDAVRAIVIQRQPPLLASLFLRGNFDIASQAVAQIQTSYKACILGLSGPTGVTIGGNSVLSGGNCTVMSNSAIKFNSAPTFQGAGWTIGATNGCSGGHCNDAGMPPHNYYELSATNPMSALDTMFNGISGNGPKVTCGNGQTCTMPAAEVYGDLTISNGGTMNLTANTTYIFYNASIKMTGGTLNGTNVNIVLLGNSSLTINGGIVNLTANPNSTYPELNGVLIYDRSNSAVKINGDAGSIMNGAMYFPNADVTMSGNATTTSGCLEVVASSVTIQGNFRLDSSGCPPNTVPKVQVVTLVQ